MKKVKDHISMLSDLEAIARECESSEALLSRIKKIHGIPLGVSMGFRNKYGNGGISMKEACDNLFKATR